MMQLIAMTMTMLTRRNGSTRPVRSSRSRFRCYVPVEERARDIMATVFLLCGLPGSGKTTLARQIERARRAIRLAPDEWIAALFGPDIQQRDPETFRGPARDRTEALQRELAGHLLSLGVDVILENGFWGRSERDEYRAWARARDARVALRYLEVPREELWRRLEARNAALSPGTFHVERHELDGWFDHFEAPTAEELALNDE